MTNLQNASAIVVSHNSSLRAIRFARCRYGYLPWRALSSFDGMSALAHSSANEGAIDEAELVRHGCWNGTDRQSLEVLLSSKGAQRTRGGICQHVCSRPLPQGSLCEVSRNLYCTSPALTLLQLSATQDLPTALAIAFELCGTFSLSELATDPAQTLQDLKSPTYHEAEAVLTRTRLMHSFRQWAEALQVALHAPPFGMRSTAPAPPWKRSWQRCFTCPMLTAVSTLPCS